MVKPTDQETVVTEKTVHHSYQEEEAHHTWAIQGHTGPHREAPGLVRSQRERGMGQAG